MFRGTRSMLQFLQESAVDYFACHQFEHPMLNWAQVFGGVLLTVPFAQSMIMSARVSATAMKGECSSITSHNSIPTTIGCSCFETDGDLESQCTLCVGPSRKGT